MIIKVILLSYGKGGRICYCKWNRGKRTCHLGVLEKKKLQKPAPEEEVAQTSDKMINSWKLHIVLCECFTQRNQPFWTGFIHMTILRRVDTLPLLPSHDNDKICSPPGNPELSTETQFEVDGGGSQGWPLLLPWSFPGRPKTVSE